MVYPVDTDEAYLIERYGSTQSWREIPHTGDDWARKRDAKGNPKVAAPRILAAHSGSVIHAGWRGVAGNLIAVRAWFGRISGYAHLSKILVREGDTVREGQQIGLMGGTGGGKLTGIHLHYSEHTEAGLAKLLGGYYPYWKSKTGKILWSSVAAWANASGLLKPDYRLKDSAPAPKPPAKTPEQIEEEELMNARDDIIKVVRAEARMVESRLKREIRPEPYFISKDEQGNTYTIDDSPFAALVHPASGFIMPLLPSDENGERGQVDSLKARYRIINEDTQSNGFIESVFWNTLKDVARGAGIIDRNISEADGVAWAKSLFDG